MAVKSLPADIWIGIIENYTHANTDLKTLASIDKMLRDLTLPTLFYHLTFELRLDQQFEENIAVSAVRAKSLKKSPHLIFHVRSFCISNWHRGASVVWSSTYNVITSLLLALPRVRTLRLHKSDLREEIYALIIRNSPLVSLEIEACTQDLQNPAIFEEHTTTQLRHLTFDQRQQSVRVITSSCFTRIIEGCLLSLTSLTVTVQYIPDIASLLGPRPISLTYIKILPMERDHQDESPAMCKLLTSCTELCRLEISCVVDFDLTSLPPHSLPKLTSLEAPWRAVAALVSGRPVDDVRISTSHAFEGVVPSSQLDTLRHSTVPITSLSVTVHETFIDQISHLAHSVSFSNLTCLYLIITYNEPRSLDLILLKYEIKYLIRSITAWPQLKHCYMWVAALDVDLDKGITAEEAECPVAPRNDPSQRGHPSLESIQLISRFGWDWVPGEGWICVARDVFS